MVLPPEFDTLKTTLEGAVLHVEFNRPDRLNALSHRLLTEIVELCARLRSERDIRVVVVSGAGRAFSAGFDLGDFTSTAAGDSPRDGADLGRMATEALTDVPQVTVAAVHGHCVGGGLVLVGACDLRIVEDGTRFSIPEVDLGIPLAWGGLPRLVREIGPALTKELVLTCRPFGAEEAKAIGFVNEVVPNGTAVSRAKEMAVGLAAKPLYALRTTKQQVNALMEEMVGTGRSAADADALVYALRDPESRSASAKYLASRTVRRT
jgi:enoyl-CoA hydratase/carnithine racemase